MDQNKNMIFYIPLQDVDDEHCALIIDKALASVKGVLDHRVEINNSRAVITAFSDSQIIANAVGVIRGLGYEVISVVKEYPLIGLCCDSDELTTQKALQKSIGVINATVNYSLAKASIDFIPALITIDQLQLAVKAVGCELLVDHDETLEQTLENIQHKYYRKLKIKTFCAVIFSIPIVLISIFKTGIPYANYISWFLTTIVLVAFGNQFYIGAWKQLKHRSANMYTLVSISTSVAYLISVFNTIYPQFWISKGLPADVYFEAASVIVAIILLGNMLEERAKDKTSDAIKNLMGLQPKFVTVVQPVTGEQIQMSITNIQTGDLILAKSGEKIAVDGVVSKGTSYVDESMISGESFPVLKNVGSKVFAGTINQKGSFQYLAQEVGDKTILAQIIRMVQKAQGSRAPVQRYVDVIAAIFVPVVILISLITLCVWLVFDADVSHGILAMVTVLIISCPCAFGIATPTAIMVGVGKAASQGILIKDADALERAKNITAVVLDKTGTLTVGKPSVVDQLWILPQDPFYKNLLYSIELSSNHPISQAIIENYKSSASYLSDVETTNIAGRGIEAYYQDSKYYIGNIELLLQYHIRIDDATRQWIDDQFMLAHTLSFFINANELICIIAVSDPIKPTSTQAVAEMKKMGLKVYMFTGDNEFSAAAVARQTGIEDYKSSGMPSDKAEFVKALQKQGEFVAMVGDGINDTGALALADVSIAMGKGSDIAMDVAKITIISSDLIKIPQAIRLSKQTVQTIRVNLFWAFFYNVISIPIAAGALYLYNGFTLDPILAATCEAFSSICVVGNSLLLKVRK